MIILERAQSKPHFGELCLGEQLEYGRICTHVKHEGIFLADSVAFEVLYRLVLFVMSFFYTISITTTAEIHRQLLVIR